MSRIYQLLIVSLVGFIGIVGMAQAAERPPTQSQWVTTNEDPNFPHVVEEVTLELKHYINPILFGSLDRILERNYLSKQPGFINREAGITREGIWKIVTRWETLEDAEAAMTKFKYAPAAKGFIAGSKPSTISMHRYQQ